MANPIYSTCMSSLWLHNGSSTFCCMDNMVTHRRRQCQPPG